MGFSGLGFTAGLLDPFLVDLGTISPWEWEFPQFYCTGSGQESRNVRGALFVEQLSFFLPVLSLYCMIHCTNIPLFPLTLQPTFQPRGNANSPLLAITQGTQKSTRKVLGPSLGQENVTELSQTRFHSGEREVRGSEQLGAACLGPGPRNPENPEAAASSFFPENL